MDFPNNSAYSNEYGFGGKISGGNFNPAVSIMMFMKGDLKGEDLPGYIIAQILGGLAALSSRHSLLVYRRSNGRAWESSAAK